LDECSCDGFDVGIDDGELIRGVHIQGSDICCMCYGDVGAMCLGVCIFLFEEFDLVSLGGVGKLGFGRWGVCEGGSQGGWCDGVGQRGLYDRVSQGDWCV